MDDNLSLVIKYWKDLQVDAFRQGLPQKFQRVVDKTITHLERLERLEKLGNG